MGLERAHGHRRLTATVFTAAAGRKEPRDRCRVSAGTHFGPPTRWGGGGRDADTNRDETQTPTATQGASETPGKKLDGNSHVLCDSVSRTGRSTETEWTGSARAQGQSAGSGC